MARESNLERRCRLETEKRGGKLFKFISPGNKGVHDRLLVMPHGILAFIEFKRSEKAEVQPLQDYWQKWFTQRRHRAYRIHQFNDFMKLMAEVDTETVFSVLRDRVT